MILYLEAKSPHRDLLIDYITVQLRDGRPVSLNWDNSIIERKDDGFSATYYGICFNEKDASGQLAALEGMKVLEIQTYSSDLETLSQGEDITLTSMCFEENGEKIEIEAESPDGYMLRTLAEEAISQHKMPSFDINVGMLKYQLFAHGRADEIPFGMWDVDAVLADDGKRVRLTVKTNLDKKKTCTEEVGIWEFYSAFPLSVCRYLEGMKQKAMA